MMKRLLGISRAMALGACLFANFTVPTTAATCYECNTCWDPEGEPQEFPCCKLEPTGHKSCQVSGSGCMVVGTCTEV
jgi:hypothetical protein